MVSSSEKRWGDEEDDDISYNAVESSSTQPLGGLTIPPTHTSRIDSKGNKIVTSYRANPSNPTQSLLKTVTKIKVTTATVREHVDVAKRRQWKKFGQAATDEDQSNVTIQSRDDIFMEDPNADTDLQDEDVTKALAGNLNEFWQKQQRRHLERKYDVDGKDEGVATELGEGWHKVGAKDGAGPAAGGPSKYVPPSARAGMASKATGSSLADLSSKIGAGGGSDRGSDNREQNTIRVTNISEDTTEKDLQDLFQPFGRITRVYLAKDKETMQSRGFAFVSFVHREDASRAMDKLQGYGYDHLILKLEWARPSAPKDPSTEATQFRSGYGKALAQDTKQKVSFASNLTR